MSARQPRSESTGTPASAGAPRGAAGRAGEVGAARHISREATLEALGLARTGRVFDLDPGRAPGMPQHSAQPPFDVSTYRTPHGERLQGDLEFLQPEVNADNFGFVLEKVTGSTHSGTHIDALCHVTTGPDSHWFGGFAAAEHLGDKGALTCDASTLPAIIARGVMIDVAGARGREVLEPSEGVDAARLAEAVHRQGCDIRRGDVVLIRTGQMRDWPRATAPPGREAGLSLDGARWLSEREPLAVGADNSALEVMPSGVPGSPQPVHVHLMVEHGIYILEWIYLEELAAADVREFLFLCLPLKIEGATGSMVRPIAVI